jgi:molybdopterin molybdotransferase
VKLPTPAEALARMLAQVGPLEREAVALEAALGRALAQDVDARRDQPPFDSSSMDGWAVRRADALTAEASLKVIGESAAGRGLGRPVGPGEAARIFTGAPVPDGADWVVIQENATREGDAVRLGPLETVSRNIRPRGGDFAAGQRLLSRGERLDPWRISLAAAAGLAKLEVARQPRVAVLSTGDEIVPAGGPVGPWAIWNSGGPALQALCRTWGAVAHQLAPAGDSEADIAAAVSAAEAELLVVIGGASVGEHDLVKPALKRLGLELFVDGVAMRPGKPSWFGRLGSATGGWCSARPAIRPRPWSAPSCSCGRCSTPCRGWSRRRRVSWRDWPSRWPPTAHATTICAPSSRALRTGRCRRGRSATRTPRWSASSPGRTPWSGARPWRRRRRPARWSRC